VLADPDDDLFLRCALVADAAYIVSGDSHLLDLGIYEDIVSFSFDQLLPAWYNAGSPQPGRRGKVIRRTNTCLRALEHDDLPHCVRWINDPEVCRFLVRRYPLSLAEEETWWQSLLQREHDFAIVADDVGQLRAVALHAGDSDA